jgi:hypothetical protein
MWVKDRGRILPPPPARALLSAFIYTYMHTFSGELIYKLTTFLVVIILRGLIYFGCWRVRRRRSGTGGAPCLSWCGFPCGVIVAAVSIASYFSTKRKSLLRLWLLLVQRLQNILAARWTSCISLPTFFLQWFDGAPWGPEVLNHPSLCH